MTEEHLRYAYLTGQREVLIEHWQEETERRGYLTLLDVGTHAADPVGPVEAGWIRDRVNHDQRLASLLARGASRNADANKLRNLVLWRLGEAGLTDRQIAYAADQILARVAPS